MNGSPSLLAQGEAAKLLQTEAGEDKKNQQLAQAKVIVFLCLS